MIRCREEVALEEKRNRRKWFEVGTEGRK